jgi:hypothetical protein
MDSASTRGTLSAILGAAVVVTACYASFAGRDTGDEGGFDVPAEDASSDEMPEARSWLRRLGEEGRFMRPAALTELPAGDLVLLGYRPDELLAQEVLWAIRLAPDGGVLWQRKFPSLPREFAHGTARRRGGGYLAVGDVEYFTGSSGGAAVFAFNEECALRTMPITDSGASRSPIPEHGDHRFRAMAITRSGPSRSPRRGDGRVVRATGPR